MNTAEIPAVIAVAFEIVKAGNTNSALYEQAADTLITYMRDGSYHSDKPIEETPE